MFRSVTLKFLAFLFLLSSIFSGVIYFFFQENGAINLQLLYPALFLYVLCLLGFFLFFISTPLFRVVREMKLLLGGKKYRRINPSSSDEIAIVTHFFNKITLSLESISDDIIESKRLTSEIDIARKIQNDIFPNKAPAILGLDIVARSRPAAEMGGDSFDFLQNEHQTMLYIGDVTGHGVPAGLVMMMVNTLIHAFAKYGMLPHEILTRINRILNERISAAQFMSLVMLRWDEQRQKMFFIGAGHEYILVYRAKEKKVERIQAGGIALRMAPNIDKFIEERNIPLEDGDVVVLYSDGITEGKNKEGEMYGIERLQESVRRNGHKVNAEKIFDALTKNFSDFIGEYVHQEDDITMIVIKKLPPGEKIPQPIKLLINGVEEGVEEKRWDWEK